MHLRFPILLAILLAPSTGFSTFEVCLVETRTIGQKALLKLEVLHTFPQPVRSARALVFLRRADGVVVGREVRWMIGSDRGLGVLPPNLRTNFYFVVPIEGPYNRIHFDFNRVVLADGTSADTKVDWQEKRGRRSGDCLKTK